ncbi:MAG: VOC family protein [Candidatus Odinarchaeota archaeon]
MTEYDEDVPFFSKFSKVDQIGIVVKDMETSMKFYKKMFRPDPFLTLEIGDSSRLKLGIFQLGEVQIELIQIIKGETIHSRFLEKHGEGLHHLGFFVENLEEELALLEKGGIKVLEEGNILEAGKYAYLDTEKLLGIVLELIQLG